ncbi:hypothetical protein [Jannaschia sp. M317]|uniref:hypothetical protein n=1 Tax=Jannaschia sp. M317 TaxID=2867011 RepID=UPI0021A47A76|nr:hypothetical protein [Jannaschia sp. M317]UWQ17945.1 hypothetical protein K3551_01130 [Jannaschia sp. M317]
MPPHSPSLAPVAWMIAAAALTLAVATGAVGAQTLTPAPVIDLSRLGGPDSDARRITVTLTPGIRSGRELRSASLKDTRRRLSQDQPVTRDALRALADAGDGMAALHLARQFDAEGLRVNPANLAHYYGMAAATGRLGGLFGLVDTLKRVDPEQTSEARLAMLKRTVLAYAQAGNSVAIEALAGFHSTGRPFGPLDADLQALATTGAGQGAALIALQLASDRMQTGWNDAQALTEAQGYLRAASSSKSVRVQLLAVNLLPLLQTRLSELTGEGVEG